MGKHGIAYVYKADTGTITKRISNGQDTGRSFADALIASNNNGFVGALERAIVSQGGHADLRVLQDLLR